MIATLVLLLQTQELRIDPKGEPLAVDVSVLRALDPAATFTVEYDGQPARSPIEARPGGELAIVGAGARFVIALIPADKRRAWSSASVLYGRDVALASYCDTGSGKWKVPKDEKRYPMWGRDQKVTLDGVALSTLAPLVRGARSGFYVVPAESLQAWRRVAQTCYDAILHEQWAIFVSTFNSHDQGEAEDYRDCRMYWNAVRRTIEGNDVVEFRFKNINPYSTGVYRKLMFRRIDDDGQKVGLDTAIMLVLEDGEWKIESVSP